MVRFITSVYWIQTSLSRLMVVDTGNRGNDRIAILWRSTHIVTIASGLGLILNGLDMLSHRVIISSLKSIKAKLGLSSVPFAFKLTNALLSSGDCPNGTKAFFFIRLKSRRDQGWDIQWWCEWLFLRRLLQCGWMCIYAFSNRRLMHDFFTIKKEEKKKEEMDEHFI